MKYSKSYHQQVPDQINYHLPSKIKHTKSNIDLPYLQKTINQLILKSDKLQKQTKMLSKMIKNTQLQVQKLQQQNRQLKSRLRKIEKYSRKSMSYTNHQEDDKQGPSMLHYMSEHRISNVQTYQGQYHEEISLLDGIEQPKQQEDEQFNKKALKSKLKLDFSTIKKTHLYQDEQATKQKQKSSKYKTENIYIRQFQEVDSQIYSQYNSSIQIQSLQRIKAQLIAFKHFFQKLYGQKYTDFMMQNDNTQHLRTKFQFIHMEIESSRNIKQHLTNQNNKLRQRNKIYKEQLIKTQEQLGIIKNIIVKRLVQENMDEQ